MPSSQLALVSIIVPVYNVEKYVERCIRSIQAQSLKAFECLIVDDASPDNSISLVQLLIQEDPRFKIIQHTQNQGLGPARNTGIKYAQSEYLCFVDSDDYIEPDFLELFYNTVTIQQTNIALCASNVITKKNMTFPNKIPTPSSTWEEVIINQLLGRNFSTAWSHIFHKSLFQCIQFPRGHYEDGGTLLRIIIEHNISSIPVIQKPIYNYVQRSTSIMNSTISLHKLYDYVHNILRVYVDYMFHNNKFSIFQEYFAMNIFIQITHNLHLIFRHSDNIIPKVAFLKRLFIKYLPSGIFQNFLASVCRIQKQYKPLSPLNFVKRYLFYILNFKCAIFGIYLSSVLVVLYRKTQKIHSKLM